MKADKTTVNVSVKYEGEIRPDVDKEIRRRMEAAGFVWFGQGYDMRKQKRDIAFVAVWGDEVEGQLSSEWLTHMSGVTQR